MKDFLKIALNMTAIFVCAGIILSLVFVKTAPVIRATMEKEKEQALKSLMPEASSITAGGTWEPVPGKEGEYYAVKDKSGLLGYEVTTWSKGYSSFINILVGLNKDMSVRAIEILGHAETPGLGDEIEQPYFKGRFKGKRLDQLEVVKNPDPNAIEAISGATISSRAVAKGVRDAVKFMMEKYGVSNSPAERRTGQKEAHE